MLTSNVQSYIMHSILIVRSCHSDQFSDTHCKRGRIRFRGLSKQIQSKIREICFIWRVWRISRNVRFIHLFNGNAQCKPRNLSQLYSRLGTEHFKCDCMDVEWVLSFDLRE